MKSFTPPRSRAPNPAPIALIIFSYNIGVGISAGFVLYVILKIGAGRSREIRPGLWVFSLLSRMFFAFYPYHSSVYAWSAALSSAPDLL